ncbi:MAG TPA: ABC transporter permease [Tahibacter sp.]|uniref:ABC transporter permease n=1 Tax=Tahibacter sp. TaxID=2056211 RepID=UPI002B724540|nr:ABC transporter permease [Tahibacter sp.]HSX60167.1 ABC transporter permease [Tahibacter sp.]
MNAAIVVFWKEVIENLRDRRTVTNALLVGPLLGPLLFTALISLSITRELERGEKPIEVSIVGAEHAPNLVAFLKQNGVRPKPPVEDAETRVRLQDEDMVLRVPANYGQAWSAGKTAQVELLYDSSQRDSATPVERLRGLLQAYSSQNGAMRLMARGLSPAVASPLVVATRDQSTPQSRSGLLFAMLPYFLILSAFMGGMYLAIDTTAGERERQSLEPLFVNPVGRSRILAGKLAATFAFAMASLTLSLIAFGYAGRFIPTERIGMVLDFGPQFAAIALLVMLPLVLLATCLQTLIAAFAKSYREAQTYLSLLMLIPMLPSAMLAVLPLKAQTWMFSVPLLSQHLIVTRLVRAEAVTTQQLALCLGSGIAIAALAAFATAQVYRSEKLAISG